MLDLLLVMLEDESLLVVNFALHVALHLQALPELVVLLDLFLSVRLRLLRLEPASRSLLLLE